MPYKILVVEDSRDYQLTIEAALRNVAELTFVSTVADAEKVTQEIRFDLCLLDVMLPDGDGFGLCVTFRNQARHAKLPLFFLSGRNGATDKIQAFQLGADDYITKPFDPGELRARVEAKLRAQRASEAQATVLGNIRIVLETQQVFIKASEGAELRVDLSSLEFRILHFFARHEDHVISRAQLLEAVWGSGVNVYDRTVDTHISHLRKKLAGASHEIRAVKGAGYALRAMHAKAA